MAARRGAPDIGVGRPWTIIEGDSPVVAAAIHNGHELRPELEAFMGADPGDRRREEDPYTGRLTAVTSTRVIVERSRFEIDLNRPPAEAMCLDPDDCWGLELWRELPPNDLREAASWLHDEFYAEMHAVLDRTRRRHGRFVVLDIHGYNHRRQGADAPAADSRENPDVNVGTRTFDHSRWGALLERFITDLSSHPLGLDVRENVKFKGRYFAGWTHANFPDDGCCLALEFKKTFMDEWTGALYEDRIRELKDALASTLAGLEEELARP